MSRSISLYFCSFWHVSHFMVVTLLTPIDQPLDKLEGLIPDEMTCFPYFVCHSYICPPCEKKKARIQWDRLSISVTSRSFVRVLESLRTRRYDGS
ncbi:hypothetical protein BJY52DRAFT_1279248 [Lactarius psammicola]|nr:hypothetical protein BJY52DRAFT_1279248 [Lactarius psammicola]